MTSPSPQQCKAMSVLGFLQVPAPEGKCAWELEGHIIELEPDAEPRLRQIVAELLKREKALRR
jgi:hypothetical protein